MTNISALSCFALASALSFQGLSAAEIPQHDELTERNLRTAELIECFGTRTKKELEDQAKTIIRSYDPSSTSLIMPLHVSGGKHEVACISSITDIPEDTIRSYETEEAFTGFLNRHFDAAAYMELRDYIVDALIQQTVSSVTEKAEQKYRNAHPEIRQQPETPIYSF